MPTNKTMAAVSHAFNFTSDKVSQNIVEYFKREKINITEDQIKQVLYLVESSIGQSFTLTGGSIEKTLK